jgi:hypothetical protein
MSFRRLLRIACYLAVRTGRLFCARVAFIARLERMGFWLMPRYDARAQLHHELLKDELGQAREQGS